MFAIVDVETTGGIPSQTRIIEIAIILLNNNQISSVYHTLVNPLTHIPPFITRLTGISDAMTRYAPAFKDIAPDIAKYLQNRIFVAHNVRFDYTCIKTEMNKSGLHFSLPLLCTVELSRKAFPQLSKYNLNYICKHLQIPNNQPHRAKSDALATAHLFLRILNTLQPYDIASMIKRDSYDSGKYEMG